MLSQIRRVGFVEEGRFREHAYYKDRYWDLFRYALYRDKWLEIRERWHRVLTASADVSAIYELIKEQREVGDGAEAQ